MEEKAPPAPSPKLGIISMLTGPRTQMALALAAVLCLAGAGAVWKLYVMPVRAVSNIRFQAHGSLMRLYDLQMAYHGAHKTYANDLETLLASASDGAQLREKLKASVDINTLAVVGDADRFRLEINMLDLQRTSVKIRGPLGER